MKTKELIAKLLKADPEGNNEVVVNNEGIHYVSPEPGYHDGNYQILERDEKEQIIGVTITGTGTKIQISVPGLEEIISWGPKKCPVKYGDVGAFKKEMWEKKIAAWTKEYYDILKKLGIKED